MGVLDFSGHVLAKKHLALPPKPDPEAVFQRFARAARTLVKRTNTKWVDLRALGMTINGYLEQNGVLRYSTVLPWRDVPLRRLARDQFCMPAFCTNSQHKAVSEYRHGVGRGGEVMLYFHVADGVSARPVVRGELFRGVGSSGEIGHIVFRRNGPECGCGLRGCLEALISGPAMCRRILEVSKPTRSKKLNRLVSLAKQGRASSAIQEMVRLVEPSGPNCINDLLGDIIDLAGQGLATAVACFGPDRVVVDGYVFRGRSKMIAKV